MKALKQLISEVMEANTTLPFDYSMRTRSRGHSSMINIHSYKSTMENKTESPDNITTTIYHHVKDNTHHIDFTVNGEHTRPKSVSSDPGLALRAFSVVIGHMLDYRKKNPRMRYLTYTSTRHDKNAYAKSRIYARLADEHGIDLRLL